VQLTRAFYRNFLSANASRVNGPARLQGPGAFAAGATNGTAFDGTRFGPVGVATINLGALTGTEPFITVAIQQSLTGLSGWTTIATAEENETPNTAVKVGFNKTLPWLRSVITVSGSSAPTAVVSVTADFGTINPFTPNGMSLGLFTAVNDMGLDTTFADVTQPSGAPGAASNWGLGAPLSVSPQGYFVMSGGRSTWRPTNSSEACVVAGWFLRGTATPGELIGFDFFPAPIALPDENAVVSVIPYVALPLSAVFAGGTIIDG